MGKNLLQHLLLLLFVCQVMSVPAQYNLKIIKIMPNNEKQNISYTAKDVSFGNNFAKFIGYFSFGIPAKSLEISPNEKLLAILSQRKLFLLEIPTGNIFHTFNSPDSQELTSVVFSPDNTKVIASNSDNIFILDLETKTHKTLPASILGDKLGKEINAEQLAISNDGSLLASTGWLEFEFSPFIPISLWNLTTFEFIKAFGTGSGRLAELKFSPNDSYLMTARGGSQLDGYFQFWNVTTGLVIETFPVDVDPTAIDSYNPQNIVVVGGSKGELILYNISSSLVINRLPDQLSSIISLSFSSNGKFLASSSLRILDTVGNIDPNIHIWNVTIGQKITSLVHDTFNREVKFSPDGTFLAAISIDGNVMLWNMASISNDADFDGMDDTWETDYNLNPSDFTDKFEDNDIDGLINSMEHYIQSNPNVNDTDTDLIPDGWEYLNKLNPIDSNDALLDFDSDGITNLEEFLLGSNPNRLDSDGDGLLDSEEINYWTDINNIDTDGDGLNDTAEIFIYFTNPNNKHSDNDEMPDDWEVYYRFDGNFSKDANGDPDEDGLTNLQEYMNDLDPKDSDTDGDKITDGWEVKFGLNASNPLDALNDDDNDILTNLQEFQNSLNPFSNDTDGDGMPDDWEVIYGLNGNSTFDAFEDGDDKDGLSNLKEYEFGTDPMKSDTDCDGMDDGWEYRYGLNGTLSDDKCMDSDGDLLDNYYEYKLDTIGFRPDKIYDVLISTIIFLTVIIFLSKYLIRWRRTNQEAKLLGFLSQADKKQSLDLGFSTPILREEAKSKGFLSSAIRDIIRLAGYTCLLS